MRRISLQPTKRTSKTWRPHQAYQQDLAAYEENLTATHEAYQQNLAAYEQQVGQWAQESADAVAAEAENYAGGYVGHVGDYGDGGYGGYGGYGDYGTSGGAADLMAQQEAHAIANEMQHQALVNAQSLVATDGIGNVIGGSDQIVYVERYY
ncbi:hypothetical protein VTJ49DRAFT_7070 [Mycothermus thermophilus]|uniref:Uncharacterized protein n=1 Tax=Humicola insolens TaxID=85995 RepID=A0ABR3V218_HUMIN